MNLCKLKSILRLTIYILQLLDHSPIVIEDTQQTIGLILASSGTTGAPKAICLSHAMVLGQILRCT